MTKIQIQLNDGNILNADVVDYNATDLASRLNDQKIFVIQVGEVIINKGIIKLIMPVTVPAQA
jgi:hypothetical protein